MFVLLWLLQELALFEISHTKVKVLAARYGSSIVLAF